MGPLGLLLLLGSTVAFPAYDQLVEQPRRRREERRTNTSSAVDRYIEDSLIRDEDERAGQISRSIGAQQSQMRAEQVLEERRADPTGLGLVASEVALLDRLAYRPGPSPAEVLAQFGVR